MIRIDNIISSNIKKLGLEKYCNEYKLITGWKDIVGEQLAKISLPSNINFTTLFVIVNEPIWIQHLSFLEATLIEKINNFLGSSMEPSPLPSPSGRGNIVKKIIFKYGVFKPVEKEIELSTTYSRRDILTNKNKAVKGDMSLPCLSEVRDKELKEILKRIYGKIL